MNFLKSWRAYFSQAYEAYQRSEIDPMLVWHHYNGDDDDFVLKHPKAIKVILRIRKLTDWCDDKFHYIRTPYYDLMDWIFQGPYKLKIHTLSCREWNEFDVVMLHSAFQCIVDFVELDLIYDDYWFNSNAIKYRKGRRYPEAGKSYLQNHLELNSNAAILFLYRWYKESYIPRMSYMLSEDVTNLFPVQGSKLNTWSAMANAQATFLKSEEDDMMNLLMRVRHDLWS